MDLVLFLGYYAMILLVQPTTQIWLNVAPNNNEFDTPGLDVNVESLSPKDA